MRIFLGILFMAQVLVMCAIFGNALKQTREYRTPFGKLFLPYKTQVVLCLWLIASLFANVLFAYNM